MDKQIECWYNPVDIEQTTKEQVVSYYNDHLLEDQGERISEDDVYIVWKCKVLQNWKTLAGTVRPDKMYFELTYNGDKGELYIDAYEKYENVCIRMGESA